MDLIVDCSTPDQGLTFKAHVPGIEPDKSGLSHVARKVLSKGFWVGGGECEHLFVHRQRRKDPAEETSRGEWVNFSLCVCVFVLYRFVRNDSNLSSTA